MLRTLHRRNRLARLVCGTVGAAILSGCDASASPALDELDDRAAAHTRVAAWSGPQVYGGIAWSYLTDGPVRSTPLIAGDVVFVGSSDGSLYALGVRTGELRWKYDAGAPVNSSPAADRDRVYVSTSDGAVLAIGRETGTLDWRFDGADALPLPWGLENGDFYTSSPTLVDSLVLVGHGDGHLYALDRRSGREVWRLATAGRVRTSPAVAGGLAVVGSFDGRVYAADIATGALRWRFDTEGATLDSRDFGFDRRSIQSSPAIAAGVVYLGSRDGHLYAIDLETGRRTWRRGYDMSWVIGAPAVAPEAVFTSTSDGRYIQALKPGSGEDLWTFPTTRASWSSPVVDDSAVYVGESGGHLHVLDRRTGEQRWEFRTGGPLFSSPALSEGLVVFGSNDGRVYALRGGTASLARAVYSDSLLALRAFDGDRPWIRRELAERGYAVIDGAGLAGFLNARIADRTPSVVVAATGVLPDAVTRAPEPLLRKYLEAGGKVVWVGTPPLIWPADSAGNREYRFIDRAATTRLTGADHAAANFDRYRAAPTTAGYRWGLRGWRVARWSIEPSSAIVPLLVDENRRATAWVRPYGGPPGTGFVRLDDVPDTPAALDELVMVAEYRPLCREEGETTPDC